MKEIPLTKGYVALVDDEDYEPLVRFRWHICNGYARTDALDNGRRVRFYMHRIVAAVPPGFEVDHVNRNTVDNRRSNLRPATRASQMRNTKRTHHVVILGRTECLTDWAAEFGMSTHRLHKALRAGRLAEIEARLRAGEAALPAIGPVQSCPRGHAYDEQNTYIGKDGDRECRTCHREQVRAAKRRKSGLDVDFPGSYSQKASDADVRAMRAAYQAGTTQKAPAAQYGLHSSRVSRLVRGIDRKGVA